MWSGNVRKNRFKTSKNGSYPELKDGAPDYYHKEVKKSLSNLCFKLEWKRELIVNTFSEEIAGKILSIPLAKDPHDDFMAWCGEPSGEYLVRSAYKLLQASENDTRAHALHTDYTSGIVARNSKGVVLLSSSEMHQEIPSAFAAEALACRKAVQIGINMQWPQIIVEGDSLTVIKKCKTKE
ncbi:hypothetical protein PVK06_040891 [Gossypium arboreum]|uniref:RNase H type-1 domain-containing protein n=1 Tax=Gossypium arboreum TaxID=29729 RepID=A0ABR0N6Q4_GOSAR|nr:hypothetical protein PVK06_040891 [Gossypium arboreum]